MARRRLASALLILGLPLLISTARAQYSVPGPTGGGSCNPLSPEVSPKPVSRSPVLIVNGLMFRLPLWTMTSWNRGWFWSTRPTEIHRGSTHQ